MSEPFYFDLPIESITALQHHAYARTFGILLFPKGVANPEAGAEGATGVGVAIGPRRFVATAGHNLVGIPDDGLVLVHEDQVAYRPTPILRRWPESEGSTPTPDLGYIELSSETANRSPKEFTPLSQMRPNFNQVNISALIVGHPAERVPQELIRQHRIINLRAMAFATRSIELPGGRDRRIEFALAVKEAGRDAESGERIETPKLHGISGGGVWTVPRPADSGLWSPSGSTLVGIEHTWLRDSQAMICTQLQPWLALIARDYKDLAGELDAIKA